jgi:hypothetical protein
MTEEKPELHPVVDLFLRRCASNPEEMEQGKWGWVLDRILAHGSQTDKDAALPVYNKLMLDELHRNFMRELLNPEQLNLFSVGSVDADINPLKAQNLWKKLGKL